MGLVSLLKNKRARRLESLLGILLIGYGLYVVIRGLFLTPYQDPEINLSLSTPYKVPSFISSPDQANKEFPSMKDYLEKLIKGSGLDYQDELWEKKISFYHPEKISRFSPASSQKKKKIPSYLKDYFRKSEPRLSPQDNLILRVFLLARQGKQAEAEKIVQSLEAQIKTIEKVQPPQIARDYHRKKIILFKNFLNLLKLVKDKGPSGEKLSSILTVNEMEPAFEAYKAAAMSLESLLRQIAKTS